MQLNLWLQNLPLMTKFSETFDLLFVKICTKTGHIYGHTSQNQH